MPPTEERFKVLIIDDSPVARKLVELPLLEKGYSLIMATNGKNGVELFEKHRPDVVITDWMLPDLSGREVCQHIRSSSQDSYAYTIVLTAQTGKENLVEALASGADDYLPKPFNLRELLARVKSVLRRVQNRSGHARRARRHVAVGAHESLRRRPHGGEDLPCAIGVHADGE